MRGGRAGSCIRGKKKVRGERHGGSARGGEVRAGCQPVGAAAEFGEAFIGTRRELRCRGEAVP